MPTNTLLIQYYAHNSVHYTTIPQFCTQFLIKLRKLSLKNSILVNISFRSKARLEKVSSFTKLIRMICVILSFQIASNFCGLTFTKSALRFLSASPQIGIILVKKSAFNNWSLNRFKLSLRIRL